jgi:hypothetical protein
LFCINLSENGKLLLQSTPPCLPSNSPRVDPRLTEAFQPQWKRKQKAEQKNAAGATNSTNNGGANNAAEYVPAPGSGGTVNINFHNTHRVAADAELPPLPTEEVSKHHLYSPKYLLLVK